MPQKKLTIVIDGDPSGGEKAIEAIGAKADAFSEKIKSIGDTAFGVFAGDKLSAGVAKLGEVLVDSLNIEVATDKLAGQLGLTAAESERYGRLAGDLYSDAYGESVSDVNDALKSVRQNIESMASASDAELKTVTAAVMDLATAFDQDLGATTKAVGQMIRTGLVKDATEGLDVLTRGFQTGADASEDLLDTFNEYSTQFRDVGLTGQQAMGMISQAMRAGARDSDIAADAIKEFAIRAKDGSDSTREGFERIGLSADEMARVFSTGGPKAAEALDLVFDRLRAIQDPAERAQLAVKLFGTQAEDMQQALFAMDPSTAVAALGEVEGAASKLGTTLADNLLTKLEALKRQGLELLSDVVQDRIIPALTTAIEYVVPFFSSIGEFAASNTEALKLLAIGGFANLTTQILESATAIATLQAKSGLGFLSSQVARLTEYLLYAREAFVAVAASQGVMVASGQALAYVLSSAAVKISVAAAAIYAFTSVSEEGTAAADKFVASLGMDNTNIPHAEAQLRTLEDRIRSMDETLRHARFADKLAADADTLIPFHDVADSLSDLSDEHGRLIDQFEAAKATVDAANQAYAGLAQKINDGRVASGLMATDSGVLVGKLKELATAEKIDVTEPGGPEKLRELAARVDITSTGVLGLKDATAQYVNVASDAKVKTDAYKQALDSLMGAHLSSWDAATQATEAIKALSEATLKGSGMFDLNTGSVAANKDEVFANRAALSSAIQAASDHAQAVFDETGSIEKASLTLGSHREQLIGVMTQMLGNRDAAERYINQLGLTPGAVNTFVNLHDQGTPERLGGMQGQMHDLGRGVTVNVYADVSAAEASLHRFNIQLNDLERRVIAGNVNYGGRFAEGGIVVRSYAAGGRESHVAQIAQAGAWRLWAEPETGGEAYIPLGPGKRDRSTAILAEVARMFGYQLADKPDKAAPPTAMPQAAPGAVPTPPAAPQVIQLVVDRRVLAEVVAAGERERRVENR